MNHHITIVQMYEIFWLRQLRLISSFLYFMYDSAICVKVYKNQVSCSVHLTTMQTIWVIKFLFPPKSFLKVIPTTFAPSFRILFQNEVYKCKVCKIKINNIGKLLCSFVLIYYEHKRVEGRDATVVCIYRVLGNEGIKSNTER